MRRKVWFSFKWISLGVSVASIVAAIVLANMGGPKEVAPEKAKTEEPKTRVESPVIVERKDGAIVWQLRAEEANQQLDGQMRLSQPKLTLYTKSNQELIIESKQAWFEPLKRNVRFQDEVQVHYDVWTMTTDSMVYVSDKDEIHVPGLFRVKGNSIKARGKNMRLHRTTEEVNVDGGIWIEDSNPRYQGVK